MLPLFSNRTFPECPRCQKPVYKRQVSGYSVFEFNTLSKLKELNEHTLAHANTYTHTRGHLCFGFSTHCIARISVVGVSTVTEFKKTSATFTRLTRRFAWSWSLKSIVTIGGNRNKHGSSILLSDFCATLIRSKKHFKCMTPYTQNNGMTLRQVRLFRYCLGCIATYVYPCI